jgi:hypothetical protein
MSDVTETNIVPVRPLSDEAALEWLQSQPGSSTTLPAAALARRWGWPEHRARRRLDTWQKAGLVRRRGRVVSAVWGTVGRTPDPTLAEVTFGAVGKPAYRSDVPSETYPQLGRSVAVRNAAERAATVAAPESGYIARLVTLDGPLEATPCSPQAAPPLPPPQAARVRVAVFFGAAIALSAVSAGYSITGMTSIFVSAFWPVVAMGVALEAGKLAAVAALPTLRWGPLKAALVALVAVLMGLNAIGAYGFLAKAHIGHRVDGDVAVAGKVADIDGRLAVQAALVSDLDRRIAQIDGAVEKATAKGRTAAAMALAGDHRKTRSELVVQRTTESRTLAAFQVERAKADGERQMVEADLGPVRYLATLLGAGDQEVLRWFILVVAMLLDPAAVLLLLAAASARRSNAA